MVTKTGSRRIANYEFMVTDDRKDVPHLEQALDPHLSHIVWKFDPEAAFKEGWRRKVEGLGEYPCGRASPVLTMCSSTEQAPSEDGLTTTGADTEQSENRLQSASSTSPRGIQARPPAQSADAFSLGTRVEYYSKTHCKWLAGTIEGPSGVDDDHGLPCYEVVVGGGVRKQLRSTVELELLRLPLHACEFVSLYREQTEQWVAAHVTHKEPMSAAVLGYQVHVVEGETEGSDFSAPAASLRPRFPEGSAAEVFVASSGWVPCTVLAQVPTHYLETSGRLWFEVDVQLDRVGHSFRVPSYRVRSSRHCVVRM